jgi:hypothetical protein
MIWLILILIVIILFFFINIGVLDFYIILLGLLGLFLFGITVYGIWRLIVNIKYYILNKKLPTKSKNAQLYGRTRGRRTLGVPGYDIKKQIKEDIRECLIWAKNFEKSKDYSLAIKFYQEAISYLLNKNKIKNIENKIKKLELLNTKVEIKKEEEKYSDNNKGDIQTLEDNYPTKQLNGNNQNKKVSIILQTEDAIQSTSQNEYQKKLVSIGKLFNNHFDKLCSIYEHDRKIIEYFDFTRNLIGQMVMPKIIEKFNQLLFSKQKQAFTGTALNNKTVVYVELYPSSKAMVKSTQFKNSYLNDLSYLLNINSSKYGITLNDIELFHIMFFIDDNNYEIDMGIAVPKFGIGIYPVDLLSQNDKQMLNQL